MKMGSLIGPLMEDIERHVIAPDEAKNADCNLQYTHQYHVDQKIDALVIVEHSLL